MKRRMTVFGLIIAVVGVGGKFWAQQYLEDHPGRGMVGNIVGELGGDVPMQTQLALILSEYGLIIGLVGLVLLVAGLVLRR